MSGATLKVALVSDVFFDASAGDRLAHRLKEAKGLGAEVALLPEIPLNPWSPATQTAHERDAEPPEGPRHQLLSSVARNVGIGLIGGAIVRDPSTGKRHNTALVFDPVGRPVTSYRKVHLPEEEGFWETRHYEPGDALSPVIHAFGMRLGVQICSDLNRPEGCHLLGAMGAEAVFNPRATEAATFSRWRTVLIANALTSGVYVLSVNRPREEQGVKLGGPSFAVSPLGDVLAETTDPVAVVTLERSVVERARRHYPAYLALRSDLYSDGWKQVTATRLPHENG